MNCPMCGVTMGEEEERCDLCGWVDERDEEGSLSPWVVLTTVTTVIEAEMIAGRLRWNGIPATVLSQVDSTRGFTLGELAIAKIYIPTRYVDEAMALLKEGPHDEEEE